MTESRPPKYRRQKGARGKPDRAFVEWHGQRIYLGVHGTAASRAAYGRIISEWKAAGGTLPVDADQITVAELTARFWRHAKGYYRKPDGTPTSTLSDFRVALRPLSSLYGDEPAAEFGPRALRTVRQTWLDADLSRKTISTYTACIRRVFKWAASHEIVPTSVSQALSTVEGLRRGRSTARETERITPVPAVCIRQVRSYVSRQIWAMIEIQRLTGMRPGEVCAMRACDLDTRGKVWTYQPEDHKTAWHGHDRVIYLGPRAQAFVRPFLRHDMTAHLFSPVDAEAERLEQRHAARTTPMNCGNVPGSRGVDAQRRRVGTRYSRDTYRRAVVRACKAADVDPWSPGRLRHNAATRLRREFGIDLAQTILGHRIGSAITEIYAEANSRKAREVVLKIG